MIETKTKTKLTKNIQYLREKCDVLKGQKYIDEVKEILLNNPYVKTSRGIGCYINIETVDFVKYSKLDESKIGGVFYVSGTMIAGNQIMFQPRFKILKDDELKLVEPSEMLEAYNKTLTVDYSDKINKFINKIKQTNESDIS